MSDEKRPTPDTPDSADETIQDLPAPDAAPESGEDVKGGWDWRDYAKAPSPTGPIPLPYPNI